MSGAVSAPAVVHTQPGELWHRWMQGREQAVRDELVSRYTELVRILAAKSFRQRFSEELEYGDYVQFGMIGLLEAVDRFDPSFGTKFETFASHRILGAILNGVESLSEKQKQIVTRSRIRAERAKSLAEGGASGGVESGDPVQHLADVAIGIAMGLMLDNAGLYLDGEPASGDTPYEQAELAELRKRLRLLVERLPPPERRVIHWHYFQLLPFEQIATMIGLTKGRVSQIHHAALRRLRTLHEETASFRAAM